MTCYNERGAGLVLLQEVGIATDAQSEPAPCAGWKFWTNDLKSWDTAIAMRKVWEDRIIASATHTLDGSRWHGEWKVKGRSL